MTVDTPQQSQTDIKVTRLGESSIIATSGPYSKVVQADVSRLQALVAAADGSNHDLLFQLGRALAASGRLEDAAQAFGRAVEIKGDAAYYRMHLGEVLCGLERLDDGIAQCEEALLLDSQLASAHLTIGNAKLKMNRMGEAIGHFHAALKLDDTLVDAVIGVGCAYKEIGNFRKALACLERARAMAPNRLRTHIEIGRVHEFGRCFDDAIASYQAALDLDEGSANAHAAMAGGLAVMGKIPEAIIHVRRAVEISPYHIGQMIRVLIGAKQEVDAEIIATAERILAESEPESQWTKSLIFSLAEYYEKVGDFGRSMALLEDGGKLVREHLTSQYSSTAQNEQVDQIIDVFSLENVERLARHGQPDDSPIFILGMMRSGTTLTEQILSSHPLVHGGGELEFISRLCRNFDRAEGKSYPENFRAMSVDASAFLGREYLAQLRRMAPESRFITDKLPGNFLYIGAIKAMLPNARIVHCIRNPIDTCLSNFQQLFDADHPATYDMRDMGDYYCCYVRLMEHWMTLFGDSIQTVVYENLVSNPETEVRRLLDGCGLPFDAACLSFFEKERPVRTASLFQVRRPVYTDSMEKWRKYEPFIGPMIEALSPCLKAHNSLVQGYLS